MLTTLLDVPAHVIGKLYRHRWMIELFFRPSTSLRAVSLSNGWLKCVAKFEHLFSHGSTELAEVNANGITIQLYVADFGELSRAVIAVLLSYLRIGQRPGVYEFHCLSWVARGIMTAADMQRVLARCQRERDLAKARRLAKQAALAQVCIPPARLRPAIAARRRMRAKQALPSRRSAQPARVPLHPSLRHPNAVEYRTALAGNPCHEDFQSPQIQNPKIQKSKI